MAEGFIDNGNAGVNGRTGQRRLLAGQESHVIEQCRFGKFIFGDRIGVMNTLPPAEKVQKLVRVTLQGMISEAANGLVVEIPTDPVNLTACCLHNHAVRTSRGVIR